MSRGSVGILFSGGLDSGLLAAVARSYGRPRLYTVGTDGSHDLRMAEEAAAILDLPWVPWVVTPDEVEQACRDLLKVMWVPSPVAVSFELPIFLIASRAEEDVLISGQGADELFGGYDRYLRMSPEDCARSMDEDLAKAMGEMTPIEDTLAGHFHKVVERPFLGSQVIDAAKDIPVQEKIRDGVRKAPLRDIATSMGLDVIASREKKAAQYGSGFMRVLRSRARKRDVSISDYLASLAESD